MCSSTVAKFLLIVINIVFLVLGLVLFILGCIAKFNQGLLLKLMAAIPGDIMDDILKAWNLGEFLGNAAVIIIIVGFCLLLVGFFGCCGAIKEVACMLWGYAAIVALVIIIQIAAAVLIKVQSGQVESMVNKVLTKSLTGHYTSEQGGINVGANGTLMLATDPAKLAWDGAQVMMDCCAVENATEYKDFFKGKYDLGQGAVPSKVPLSCCKAISIDKYTKEKAGETAGITADEALQLNKCLTEADPAYTHQTGCYDAFIDIIKSSWMMYAAILVVVMLVEIVGLVSACVVIRNAGKDYDKM